MVFQSCCKSPYHNIIISTNFYGLFLHFCHFLSDKKKGVPKLFLVKKIPFSRSLNVILVL